MAALICTLFMNFSFKRDVHLKDKASYGYVFHRSSYTTNKTGYVSTIIYQKSSCDSFKTWEDARKKFGIYLVGKYDLKSNYDLSNVIHYTGSDYGMSTKELVIEAIDKMIAAEEKAGNKIVRTDFNYLCE